MTEPVKFSLTAHGPAWSLDRDGEFLAHFSHLDQGTHEAVRLARAHGETGEPACVFVQTGDGKLIEIDAGPEVTREEERRGPDLAQA